MSTPFPFFPPVPPVLLAPVIALAIVSGGDRGAAAAGSPVDRSQVDRSHVDRPRADRLRVDLSRQDLPREVDRRTPDPGVGPAAAAVSQPEARDARPPVSSLVLRGTSAPARPGDVVVLEVRSPIVLARASVTAFGRVTPMWRETPHAEAPQAAAPQAKAPQTEPPQSEAPQTDAPQTDGPRAETPDTWRTLLGVDVETEPGTHPIVVDGETADGRRASAHGTLAVAERAFGVRRLRVDPKFSSPPASEMARIEREATRLNAIYATVTPARHWIPPVARPVADRASSTFGLRSIFNGEPRGRHNGTDFASPRGRSVRAPAGGEVVLVDDLYFTGNTVVIDHGQGLYSIMAHLESTAVEAGDVVSRRDLLGHVGATGRATGPHLHWSVRLHGARVDPLSLVAARPPTR